MGMRKARFYNVHGLPGRSSKYDNIASCRDLVLLAEELKKDPQIMFWAGMPKTQFVHSNGKVIDLRNTNHALLGKVTGVNGLKTGYTNRAGFCITATAKRGDRELIVVVTGCPDKNIRFQVVRELFEWGFQEKFLQ